MRKNHLAHYTHITISWLMLWLLAACIAPAPVAPNATEANAANSSVEPLVTNLTDGCVEDYSPDIDYFPKKATLTHSKAWSIEYFKHYKVVTVLTPWQDAGQTFQYVLVQCGTPAPAGYADATVLEVPVRSLITMASTQLPHVQKLERVDALVGHSEFKYINTPEVRAKIDAGEMVEIGAGAEVNIELAIATEPDLIMTFSSGDPAYDAHPKLIEAGLKVAINAEYMEATPVARVEWIKYTAAFFNEEAKAEAVFDEIATRYEEMAALVQGIVERPTVFAGIARNDTWSMPGGGHYLARFVEDAGGNYLWADNPSSGSIPLDFESVFARAAEADYWINTSSWQTEADAVTADPRFADFSAFENGNIYNNNARLNEEGGNDYWEGGLTNPDIVLADLVKIFHPELLPDHELVYYRNLE
jgi:iron complex transport system substrate-binding protein